MDARFEPADPGSASPGGRAGPGTGELRWWGFGLVWLVLAAAIAVTVGLLASGTGLLGAGDSTSGTYEFDPVVTSGVLATWLGALAAVGSAWVLARRRDEQAASRRRLLGGLVLTLASVASFLSMALLVPIEPLAQGGGGGALLAAAASTVLAVAGVLAGSRLLASSATWRLLVPPAVAVAVVSLALAPFADPSDPSDLSAGLFFWLGGPVFFGLAAGRWFHAVPGLSPGGRASVRYHVGSLLVAVGTALWVLVPRVLVGYGGS